MSGVSGVERVVVAMSGGVDSSLAAALSVEQGYETIGVTMHLSASASRCCSLADARDARSVAEQLGIRFYVANYTEAFEREVMEPFADAYLAGRTPIPCVACNKRFKFDKLRERARVFGASRVATGHYARIDRDPQTGEPRLRRARDRAKDQTYFLFQLDPDELSSAWFPLGDLTKEEVRGRARSLALKTADKPESQEICFVPDGDYARVVERIRPAASETSGDVVDAQGRVLARHCGVHHFTVGQRKGLGVASSDRLYVNRIDAARARVVVGSRGALDVDVAEIDEVNWISGAEPPHAVRAAVQIRYRHTPVPAVVEPRSGRRARVVFDEPVRALAPGQAAVFYGGEDGDAVLGGGWIAGPGS